MFAILKTQLVQTFHFLVLVWGFLYHWIYLWLPIFLASIFVRTWLNYLRAEYIFTQGYFVVEIKIPREIMKTPLAMETFLHALWQKPTSTYIDTYWHGKVQPWFSLEMVSIGG